jgi:glycosyltransferase involved in cell wall biosynthesis
VAERALHIGVDAREVLGRPTGVGRYLMEVVRAWAADATLSHTFTFFVPSDLRPDWPPPDPRFHVVVAPGTGSGTWWEQLTLPRALAKARLDVFLGPAYTLPLRLPCPAVVFIHDVSYLAHPEWFAWREGIRRRWLTRASARRARVVLTLSSFSAQEIAHRLGVSPDRIVLAAPGAPPIDPPDPNHDTPREPVVLYVGSLFTRRRIPDLIRGFAEAATRVPAARLVLVGDNRADPPIDPRALATAAGVGAQVEWRSYVADTELEALYRRARVFAVLSEYEGYLLTPLEAFAHGVPAILLDTPIAREAYGDAATLVSTGPAALAAALVPLLTDDRAHAAAVKAGLARLARSSWSDAGRAVLTALTRAADS